MQKSSESEQDSAAELISRSVGGDLPAFRLLMESHQQYAYAVAFRLLHDTENTKDVVQEAFIRVWNNLHAYRREVKFTTWLYKIVINLCYDRMKMESRRKRWLGYFGGLTAGDEVAQGPDLDEEIGNADLRRSILLEAKKLPPRQQLVFRLRDVQDFSLEEIAEMADMSISSAKTNLCYARRRIRIAVMHMRGGEK